MSFFSLNASHLGKKLDGNFGFFTQADCISKRWRDSANFSNIVCFKNRVISLKKLKSFPGKKSRKKSPREIVPLQTDIPGKLFQFFRLDFGWKRVLGFEFFLTHRLSEWRVVLRRCLLGVYAIFVVSESQKWANFRFAAPESIKVKKQKMNRDVFWFAIGEPKCPRFTRKNCFEKNLEKMFWKEISQNQKTKKNNKSDQA